MPLYEYHCTQCNENTEILQKMSDEPAKTCPHCHTDHLIKQISATQFQLKGNGWYVTDFRDQKKGTPAAASPPKTETSTSSKSE